MTRTSKGIETVAGDLWSLEIEFSYFPGDPGQTSGPPERCWPPEPAEFEFLSVKLSVRKTAKDPWVETGVDLLNTNFLADLDLTEFLEEKCLDKLGDMDDFPEPDRGDYHD